MQRNLFHPDDSRSRHENDLQELQAELKLLQWHKLANEAALQTALMRVKALRREEAALRPKLEDMKRKKRRDRLRRAREDEESKPLMFTKEMRLFLEQEEKRHTSADEKRYERRFDQMVHYQQMITEKKTLKNRRDYCRVMQTSLDNQGNESVVWELDRKKAENLYPVNEEIKHVMERMQRVMGTIPIPLSARSSHPTGSAKMNQMKKTEICAMKHSMHENQIHLS